MIMILYHVVSTDHHTFDTCFDLILIIFFRGRVEAKRYLKSRQQIDYSFSI